ncbi:hypothetical protein C6P41_000744 [Kluyveromyces marxianus]|nr:hypothetical protein C6P43_003447 [Kluyveromyces marxianus]KAG0679163.1 hypothetical protein C6P41_000744 [Kluyveromyces marxianus]
MGKSGRSPLKENNPNTMGAHLNNPKKRSLDLLELEVSNRQKQRTLRTIEGAIAHPPNALLKTMQGGATAGASAGSTSVANALGVISTGTKLSAPGGVAASVSGSVSGSASAVEKTGNERGVNGTNTKAQTQRLSNKELIDWQNNWRRIMKRDTYIYFDCSETANDNRKDVLRRSFSTLGAKIKQFFDHEVTIVITSRKITNYSHLPSTDILTRAHKRGYMKIWTLEKAARFLTNMDVDLEEMERDSINGKGLPTSNLLNLLENEKLFGSNERDPKAKREDLHYFKHPHVYLYDLSQINAPLITLEWKQQDINSNSKKHIYPVIYPGSFGRCPFLGDDTTDELQPRRIIKRYKRDKANESYAMKLRLLYQTSAEPAALATADADDGFDSNPENDREPIILPYQNIYNNSTTQYNKLVSSMARFKQPKLPRGDTFDDDEMPYGAGAAAGGAGGYKNKFQQEIRASGVQSVDANSNGTATTGNGLEPVKASNLNKDLLSLKRMVIERKTLLNTNTNANTNSNSNSNSNFNSNSNSNSTSTVNTNNKVNGKNTTTVAETKSKSVSTGVLANAADASTAVSNATTSASTKATSVKATSAKATSTSVTQQRVHQPIGKQNPGYCENCKVKYDSLETHVNIERHTSFANKDSYFEGVDAMIQCVRQFRDINSA